MAGFHEYAAVNSWRQYRVWAIKSFRSFLSRAEKELGIKGSLGYGFVREPSPQYLNVRCHTSKIDF